MAQTEKKDREKEDLIANLEVGASEDRCVSRARSECPRAKRHLHVL